MRATLLTKYASFAMASSRTGKSDGAGLGSLENKSERHCKIQTHSFSGTPNKGLGA